ncbi:hypothetical protein Y032_0496g2483 [Ancylostoma ceylanicum]|uniref:Uncharacterized protein n=1 Tax=Ancylostoma ceylanicum TaxID=53326 RepID=A0A016WVR8_9BILA|nr:hypothetical protein Y032_0496g2483 [Ancylostoma ceylanicum]
MRDFIEGFSKVKVYYIDSALHYITSFSRKYTGYLQLSAYRRAWWALWLLVAMLAIVVWGIVIYAVVSKGTSPRNKPYDNIVITR